MSKRVSKEGHRAAVYERHWFIEFLNGFVDLLYPPNCALCGRISSREICHDCLSSFVPLEDKTCFRCGNPTPSDEPCPYCLAIQFHFDRAVSFYLYVEPLRDAVLDFKYHASSRKGKALAGLLGSLFAESSLAGSDFDLIVPVPLTARKKKRRSYNQSDILSYGIQDASGIPVAPYVLVKTEERPSQTGLDLQGRMKNVEGSFSVIDESLVEGRNVLLVDDIITTGATVNECAKVLFAAGAKRVVAVSLARGVLG